MSEHKKLAITALQNLLGDDLHRTRCAFSRYSQEQMQEQHGESGKTRAEILREYEEFDSRVRNAIAWVESK